MNLNISHYKELLYEGKATLGAHLRPNQRILTVSYTVDLYYGDVLELTGKVANDKRAVEQIDLAEHKTERLATITKYGDILSSLGADK